MEITIYELLGLIKDNKAPGYIVYRGHKYYRQFQDYKDMSNDIYLFSEEIKDITDVLDENVEIDGEDKDIEKLDIDIDSTIVFETIIHKINELVKEINKLKKGE